MKCSNCNSEMETPFAGMQGLLLKGFDIPNPSDICLDILLEPILQEECRFCGFGCLRVWLEKK